MNYINEGFYYQVYEYDSDLVFKKLLSSRSSLLKIYNFIRTRQNLSHLAAFYIACKALLRERNKLRIMKSRLNSLPGAIFGNPKFNKIGLNYIQDKVIIIGDNLKNEKDGIEIINKYIELQKTLWTYGMHDTTYKIQSNYGIDKNGNLVCIDFGEFVFTKEQAIESMRTTKWLLRESYKRWEDSNIKKYYSGQMAIVMTETTLADFWKINIK
ncbi:MAG: hypothetical protein Q8L47_00525 [bacterium]|nr:hypothetical protein [bacterium]